jgi:hypothetical protein
MDSHIYHSLVHWQVPAEAPCLLSFSQDEIEPSPELLNIVLGTNANSYEVWQVPKGDSSKN